MRCAGSDKREERAFVIPQIRCLCGHKKDPCRKDNILPLWAWLCNRFGKTQILQKIAQYRRRDLFATIHVRIGDRSFLPGL